MTIVVVLGCAAVMAAGLYCLVRPLTVARWYKKSMAGVIMWPRMGFNRLQFNNRDYVELVLDVQRAIQPGTSAILSDIFIVADAQPSRPPTYWQITHGEDVFPTADEHTVDGYGPIQIGLGGASPSDWLAIPNRSRPIAWERHAV